MYIHMNLVRMFSVRIYIHFVYVYVGMYTHTLNIHTGRTSRTTQPSESIFEKDELIEGGSYILHNMK